MANTQVRVELQVVVTDAVDLDGLRRYIESLLTERGISVEWSDVVEQVPA